MPGSKKGVRSIRTPDEGQFIIDIGGAEQATSSNIFWKRGGINPSITSSNKRATLHKPQFFLTHKIFSKQY